MPKYKFSNIAFNITEKRIPFPGEEKTYIGLEHLDSGSLKVTRWGSDVPIKGEKLVMKKGDLLFGRRNTYLRRAAIAPHDGMFSAHGMILRPNTDIIDPDYFPFFISSDYFMDEAIKISVGSLSPTVNWKTLKELEFVLPAMEDQKRLAVILRAADETREAYKHLLLLTDELVKSQFIEMFGDAQNYINGELKKIKDVAEVRGRVGWKGYKKQDLRDEGPLVIGATQITDDGHLDLSAPVYISREKYEESPEIMLEDNDLILVQRGNTVGKTGIVGVSIGEATINPCVLILRARSIDPVFLNAYMQLGITKEAIAGIVTGSAQPMITQKSIGDFPVIVPPLEKQKEFVSFVQQSDKSK